MEEQADKLKELLKQINKKKRIMKKKQKLEFFEIQSQEHDTETIRQWLIRSFHRIEKHDSAFLLFVQC